MAIGFQQSRPVTPVVFDITTQTGIITTVDTIVHGSDHTEGTYLAVALGGGTGTGAEATVVVNASGEVTEVTITDGGTGYLIGDTLLTISNGVIGGAANATVDVASLLGEVATVTVTDGGTGWIVGDTISSDEYSTDGVGSGASFRVTGETGGVVDTLAVLTGGTGFVIADTQTYNGSGELGIASDLYVNHANYELGGNIAEYTTTGASGLTVDLTTVGGEVTAAAVNAGGSGYVVGDVVRVLDEATGGFDNGYADAVLEVATVSGTAVATLVVLEGGSNYADDLAVPTSALGQLKSTSPKGTSTLTGDNDPTITVVRLADDAQLVVQQRAIDGGAVTVFAEPTIVDGNGNVVGNTVRAEDCVDADRCRANGFIWDVNAGGYGYCRERAYTEVMGAASDADCPVGSEWDGGTGCQLITFANFGTPAGTQLEGLSNEELMRHCEGSGYFWDSVAGACIDSGTLSNMDALISGDADNPLDYARTSCSLVGGVWNPTLNAGAGGCEADDSASHLTQTACESNGYVWIAGTCYNPNDFGDGQDRLAKTATNPLAVPK